MFYHPQALPTEETDWTDIAFDAWAEAERRAAQRQSDKAWLFAFYCTALGLLLFVVCVAMSRGWMW